MPLRRAACRLLETLPQSSLGALQRPAGPQPGIDLADVEDRRRRESHVASHAREGDADRGPYRLGRAEIGVELGAGFDDPPQASGEGGLTIGVETRRGAAEAMPPKDRRAGRRVARKRWERREHLGELSDAGGRRGAELDEAGAAPSIDGGVAGHPSEDRRQQFRRFEFERLRAGPEPGRESLGPTGFVRGHPPRDVASVLPLEASQAMDAESLGEFGRRRGLEGRRHRRRSRRRSRRSSPGNHEKDGDRQHAGQCRGVRIDEHRARRKRLRRGHPWQRCVVRGRIRDRTYHRVR